MKIEWKTEKRKIKDLIPTENNPRILTEKQYNDLKKSLNKFDLAEIPAINTNGKILAGHMRLKILKELKGDDLKIDVRVPNRELTEKESKEYLIRSNKNTGEWDWDILNTDYEIEDLSNWGFENIDLNFGFEPSSIENQGKLDEIQLTICPNCGEKFDHRKTKL
jgi:ParB-like chromosome segregation protein Spo0J